MNDKCEAGDGAQGVADDMHERRLTAVDKLGTQRQHLEAEFGLLDELAAPMSEEDWTVFNAAVQRRTPFFRLEADSQRDETA